MNKKNVLLSYLKEKIRIDIFLSKNLKGYSRSYLQYLIENNHILVNDKKIKKKHIIKKKDKISITFIPPLEIDLTPQNIPLNVLYEDDDIICINKPPDMVVHPACGNRDKTFVNALLYHVKNFKIKDDTRPGIVHRLDKETTGALLAAKTYKAHKELIKMFSKRTILKKYLAICINSPKNRTVKKNIKRHPVNRKKMFIHETGKEAVSEFITLDTYKNLSLVKANLLTGRTHQLRVHLQYLKCPVLGDKTYGNKKINKEFNAQRQMLHSYSLSFTHPVSNKKINIKAPLFQDMEEYLKKFKKKILLD